MRELTDIEKHSLLDLLRQRAGTHLRDALTDSVLRKWHAAGRMVVVLDGFDEIPEERRDAVEKWVKNLSVVANKTALLVTSRPLQSGHLECLSNPWQQWDLLPFDERRVLEFIERWHRYLPEGELSAEERKVNPAVLASTFFNDPSLKPLADTPLMLGTLLFVHHRDKKLPSGRVDLYERYIAAMLGLRDSGLGIQARATKLTDREKRRVLAHIALHFHLNDVNEVNDDTMRQLVNESLAKFKFTENPERLLPALCERTGLLQGPGTWSFMHKTIGEFLVAELICDGTTLLSGKGRLDRKELWAHRHEDAWTSVLFFWAGKTTPRELEEFILDLIDEDKDEATFLVLSLLHDQGDRLAYESQRSLALKMIGRLSLSKCVSSAQTVCSTPDVPRFVYNDEYGEGAIELRGLSTVNSTGALRGLFVRGILRPEDILTVDEDCRAGLTVAVLWALDDPGSHITIDLHHSLRHLPTRDLALYCFHYSFLGLIVADGVDLKRFHTWLAEWLKSFPEGRPWVPLLLAGSVLMGDGIPRKKLKRIKMTGTKRWIGPVLWQWRNEPIAEDWLQGSDEYRGWGSSSSYDILEETRQSLEQNGASDRGISAEQHADLLEWCVRMMARREELKEVEKK